ncbi:radical SAM protein [Haliovirga abyssi]|uniref:Radical SAM protein n=1 Tax=Haliovirga abyssi TaxID=2996794 RepID=A0AAU9D4I2_9FUSO|nr:radical SAM protein [Haliovirga abyssi]BDU50869.1 radical SAM protein [Haliovirga abyssi]
MRYKYIFGPVPSRRLGVSLGIDLVMSKTCNLNCVYCECGKTDKLYNERKEYVNAEEVLNEVKDFLDKKPYLDYITFSGSGEPTLNSKLGYLIDEIKKITDTKIAILTNGTLFYNDKLIEEVKNADVIVPSLDAVSEEIFYKINRPNKELKIEKIINGLVNLRKNYKGKINLEIFIIDKLNDTKEELDKFKDVILKINPDKVQLNSLDRPPVESWVKPVEIDKLNEIIKYWGLDNVEVIKKYKVRRAIKSYSENLESEILNMLAKRPCTIKDLEFITCLKAVEINKYLDVLEKEKKIESYIGERGIFIRLKS